MDEVRVSALDLVEAWMQAGADEFAVQLVTGRPLADTLPVVIAVARAVNERFNDRPVIGAREVDAFPDGPVVAVDYCDSQDDLAAWAVELARDLGERGLDGRLVAFRPVSSSQSDSIPMAPAAACTLPLDVEAMLADLRGPLRAAPYWYGSGPETTAIVDELIPWCTGPASRGVGAVYRSGPNEQDVAPDVLPALVDLALRQPTSGDVSVTQGDRETGRRPSAMSASGISLASASPTWTRGWAARSRHEHWQN
jgi:hypothetical protein